MPDDLEPRESTFINPHTNEFCGKEKCADEADLAEIPPLRPRWVSEGALLVISYGGGKCAVDRRVGKKRFTVKSGGGAVVAGLGTVQWAPWWSVSGWPRLEVHWDAQGEVPTRESYPVVLPCKATL
jgi:hypothetical protein